MDVDKIVTMVVSILGILGVLDAGMQRYNKRTTSKYAAERDFAHLQRNQEQMKQSISVLLEENDSLTQDVIRIKTQLETLIAIQGER